MGHAIKGCNDIEDRRARKLLAAAIDYVDIDGVMFLLAGACDIMAEHAEKKGDWADRDALWAIADTLETKALDTPDRPVPFDWKALLVA